MFSFDIFCFENWIIINKSESCWNCDAQMTPDHQCELKSDKIEVEDEESEDESEWLNTEDESEDEESEERRSYRMRWTQRIEEKTDDWALKSRLLEFLEVAYGTPVFILSNEDLKAVTDQFRDGVLTPVQFCDKLQSLPCNQCGLAALCNECLCFEL